MNEQRVIISDMAWGPGALYVLAVALLMFIAGIGATAVDLLAQILEALQ